jgi:hypothetical protein
MNATITTLLTNIAWIAIAAEEVGVMIVSNLLYATAI